MEIARNVFLVLHIVGVAVLLGGFFFTMSARPKTVPAGQLHGALTMLVTGLVLVGLHEMDSSGLGTVDHAKIATKLVVLVVLLGLVLWGRRRTSVPTWTWAAIGVLTLADVVIAVFW